MILNTQNLAALFEEQLNSWEQAGSNYEALAKVLVKEVTVDGFPFKVQFNPARIVSSAAKVDAKSISERKCFLCKENRPAIQKGLEYINNGNTENPYTVLINPFPIFPKHLTIPLLDHTLQLISGRFDAMLNLAKELPGYTLFYNGPKCGASAPDHFHFQAGNKGFLTIESELQNMELEPISQTNNTRVSLVKGVFSGLILLDSNSPFEANEIFEKILTVLPVKEQEAEPMINILSWYATSGVYEGRYITLIYLRDKHRPSHYFAQDDANILLSPASVDLGGVLITPLEKDFNKISEREIKEIMDEILISESDTKAIVNKIKTVL